jgi:WD40 repeat protein
MIRARWASGGQLSPALLRTIEVSAVGVESVAGRLACVELESRPVVVSGHNNGDINVWDLATGQLLGDAFSTGTGPVAAIDCATFQGQAIAVTSSIAGHTQVWDLATRQPFHEPFAFDETFPYGVRDLTCLLLDGEPIVVVAGSPKGLMAWNLLTGRRVDRPGIAPPWPPDAIATTSLNGHPILAVALQGAGIGLWDPVTKKAVRTSNLRLSDSRTIGVGVVVDRIWFTDIAPREQPIAVTVDWSKTATAWNLSTGKRFGPPLKGHAARVHAVACTDVGKQKVAVTAASDGTIRIWNVRSWGRLGSPQVGYQHDVQGLACHTLRGQPVAIVSCGNENLQVWDLERGRMVQTYKAPRDRKVSDIAVAEPYVLTSGGGHLDAWNPATGEAINLAEGPAATVLACAIVDGQPTMLMSDDKGRPGLRGLPGDVRGKACFEAGGRPMRIVFGGGPGSVWDLLSGREVVRLLSPGSMPISDAVFVQANDATMIVARSSDGAALVWSLPDRHLSSGGSDSYEAHTLEGPADEVMAIAGGTIDGRPLAFTAGAGAFVRAWDLRSRTCLDSWPIWGSAQKMAVHEQSRRLVVAAGWDLACFEITGVGEGS